MDLVDVYAVIHLHLSLWLRFIVKQFQITKLAVCKLRAQPDPEAAGKTDFITLFDITVFLSLC